MNVNERPPARTRDEDAALRWVGAGRPVFVGECGDEFANPRLVQSAEELNGAGFESAGNVVLDELAAFFDAGGTASYVLDSPRLESPVDEDAVASFVGEDGGPGYRSGLHSISDIEDGTAVVVPGRLDDAVEAALIEYILHRPSKTLVVERAPVLEGGFLDDQRAEYVAARPAIIAAFSRVVYRGDAVAGGPPVRSLGRALGEYLSEERRVHATAGVGAMVSPLVDLPTVGERFGCLSALRRWEGLRRSIDLGTRWVLFELQDEFLCRRVEREVRAFLLELHQHGFFAGLASDRSFSVSCDPMIEREPPGATGRVVLSVTARVHNGSYGDAHPDVIAIDR